MQAKLRQDSSLDFDGAVEEVVADACELMLRDSKAIETLAKENQSLFEKIRDWLKKFAEDVRKAFQGKEARHAEAKAMLDYVDELVELWDKGLLEARESGKANDKPKIKYSILRTKELTLQEQLKEYYSGKLKGSDSFYFGETPEVLSVIGIESGPLAMPLKSFKKSVIYKHNIPRRVIKKLIEKLKNPIFSFYDDNSAGIVIDDIDGDGKPVLVAIEKNAIMDRKPVRSIRSIYGLDSPSEWIMNQTKNGKKFYAFNEERADEFLQTYGYKASVGGIINSYKDSVRNSEQNVKKSLRETEDNAIRFSLREPVEETKDLIAVHNLSAEKLQKTLELGGFAMPSIAIVKAEAGHNEFGEISVVFPKDTIDPKRAENKVYSGDAWTPVFPQVEYEADEAAASRISDTVNRLTEYLPYYYRREVAGLSDSGDIEDRLNRYGGGRGFAERYKDNYGFKQLYLAESGETVPMQVTRREKSIPAEKKAEYQLVLDRIGADTLHRFNEKGDHSSLREAKFAWLDQYGDELKDAYAEFRADGSTSIEAAREQADKQTRLFWNGYIGSILRYEKDGGTSYEETEDVSATNELIDQKIAGSDYEEWFDDLFGGIEGHSGIRNDKELFTPSGNRRSFDALHYEATLENVVKAMKQAGRKGVGTFGDGNIFGAATVDLNSIEDIKAASSRLRKMSDEEYSAIKAGFSERFRRIVSEMPNNDSLSAYDEAANVLVEAVAKYDDRADIARYIKRQTKGWANYSESIVDELEQLVADIRNMPTGYFEAKPERAVSFEEAVAYIVPDDTDRWMISELEDKGLNVQTYKAGDNADRLAKLNAVSSRMKFSRRSFSEQVDEILHKGTFDRAEAVYVGETPKILGDVGLNVDLPMLTTQKHIRNAVLPKNTRKHQHGLKESQLKRIPEEVAHPAILLDSFDQSRNTVIAVTGMVDQDKSPIIVTIKADGKGMYNNIEVSSNSVTSYYGRDGFEGFIKRAAENGLVLFVDKEKATALSAESSTSWLEQLKDYDFDTIIRKRGLVVNPKNKSLPPGQL